MTPHDAHFKQLLRAFFAEFLEAFVPELARDLDRRSIQFIDKELLRLRGGRKTSRLVDLVAKARFHSEEGFILVHLEHQASRQRDMRRRMFFYAAWLFEQTGLPVYPILLTSYQRPRTAEPDRFVMEVRGLRVFEFRYRVVQLNRLDWRDYLSQPNPAATALMARMKIAPADRPKVRAQIQRLLVTMRLDAGKMDMIAGFVSTYLTLTAKEHLSFQREVDHIQDRKLKRKVMELITEWQRQGRQEGELNIVLRQLEHRCGSLPPMLRKRLHALPIRRLETLADALLDFRSVDDLKRWLQEAAH